MPSGSTGAGGYSGRSSFGVELQHAGLGGRRGTRRGARPRRATAWRRPLRRSARAISASAGRASAGRRGRSCVRRQPGPAALLSWISGDVESGSRRRPSRSGRSRLSRHSPTSAHHGYARSAGTSRRRCSASAGRTGAPIHAPLVGERMYCAQPPSGCAGQRHHAGHRRAGGAVEVAGELAEPRAAGPTGDRGTRRLRRSAPPPGRRCTSSACSRSLW